MFYRLLIPYYGIIGFYIFFHPEWLALPPLLLLSDYWRVNGTAGAYWFVSSYAQLIILMILMGCVGPIKSMIRLSPLRFSFLFLFVSIAFKIVVFTVVHPSQQLWTSPDQLLYLVALGWLLHQVKTDRHRLYAVLTGVGFGCLGFSGVANAWWLTPPGEGHKLSLIAATVGLAYLPAIHVPRLVRYGLSQIALASLMIYLVHPPLSSLGDRILTATRPEHELLWRLAMVAVILLIGVLLYHASNRARPYARQVRRHLSTALGRDRVLGRTTRPRPNASAAAEARHGST